VPPSHPRGTGTGAGMGPGTGWRLPRRRCWRRAAGTGAGGGGTERRAVWDAEVVFYAAGVAGVGVLDVALELGGDCERVRRLVASLSNVCVGLCVFVQASGRWIEYSYERAPAWEPARLWSVPRTDVDGGRTDSACCLPSAPGRYTCDPPSPGAPRLVLSRLISLSLSLSLGHFSLYRFG
jgi:hypothetical protein